MLCRSFARARALSLSLSLLLSLTILSRTAAATDAAEATRAGLARIRIRVRSHGMQMDRAVSIIMGLCRVLLSPHTSPSSIMLPLLAQPLMLSLLKTCMLWSLSESRPQHLCLPGAAAACRMQQFRLRKAAGLHGAAVLMIFLSLSRILFLFLSHRNLHDCSCEQDKHT